ncbi:hypothetical protein [Prevotellamassilia timonensis]|uniref:hypothetical protein n=1 Tax=Prevotellamassilia timonensis TaxID=1852370 RepID=UPI003076BA88
MKRHFLFLCLLVSVMTAWADNYKVAANCTPLSELTSGYYVIRVFGDKANDNGNYLYGNDQKAQHDAASVTTSYEGKSTLTDAKYVWKIYVGETNGQKTIQLYNVGTNKFIRKNAQEGYATNNNMLGDGAIATYNTLENANSPKGFRLKSGNVFVVDDGSRTDGYLGNWAVKETDSNCAQFKVYKVGFDVTYNFELDGKTYTKKVTALGTETPKAAYEAFYTFPGYVTANWETNTVSESNNTFTVACSKTGGYPVETNKWYFMKIGIFGEGNPRNGYIFDTSSQITTNTQTVGLLNNGFAWKFEGNPFDGYAIVNAAGRRLVTSVVGTSDDASTSPSMVNIKTADKAYCDKWDVQGTSVVNSGKENAYWSTGAFVLSAKDHSNYIIHAYNSNKVGYWKSTAVDEGSAIVLSNTLPAISLNESDGKHYATYYLPFAAKAPEGVKAYAGTVSNGSVKLTEYANGVIPANTGVLLVSDNATSATFTLANNADVTAIDNDLKGVNAVTELTGVDNSERVRIFSTKDGVAGFYKPNSNITSLAANKAYVLAPSTQEALALNFGGDVTAINSVSDNAAMPHNAVIYDLAGRRVSHAVKGVYVINGKKIIVK